MSLLNRPQSEWDDYLSESSRPKRWWKTKKFWTLVLIVAVSVLIVVLSGKYIRV
jgi:hypothetical protein